MKLLFTIGNLKKGGAERVLTNLTNFLVNNHEIIIVTTTSEPAYYELDKKIKIYHLDDNLANSNLIVRNVKRIKKLKSIIQKEKPNIAVSFLPEPSYRLMLAKGKMPAVISVRNDPKIEYNNIIKKVIMKFLYSKADGFVFQTEEAKLFFDLNIQKKSCIIPNPINEKFIGKYYERQRKKEIVNVGRLNKQKNQFLLINSFYEIQKKYSDYSLKIYGEGDLKNELNNYIKKLNLENKVFLMGEVNDIQKEIKDASLFVLSSDYEGMPNALMEAMALGLPCISTNCPCGGPEFLIKNNYNGILVSPNSPTELIEAMENVLSNKEKSEILAKNATKIGEELNPKKINKKWECYIRDVLRLTEKK